MTPEEIAWIREQISSLNERMGKVETFCAGFKEALENLKDAQGTPFMLIKWVIFPLMMIVAALVGVKLVLPGT